MSNTKTDTKGAKWLDDYVPVNVRIKEFYEKFPNGSLQSEIIEINETRVVMRGYAYRTPDDIRPGIGHAMMKLGTTNNFTRDAELECSETSAWGRALGSLGIAVHRSVASADEIRGKRGEEETPQAVTEPEIWALNMAQVSLVNTAFDNANQPGQKAMASFLKQKGYTSRNDFFKRGNDADFNELVDEFSLLEMCLEDAS